MIRHFRVRRPVSAAVSIHGRARNPSGFFAAIATTVYFSLVAVCAAQVGPGPAVAVQLEKYSGSGSVIDVAPPQFQYLDDNGKQFVVSASPGRVFAGVRYSQIDPLELRIQGTFPGERLEPGMLVAFPAMMVGRKVAQDVDRLTVVTPSATRPPGIHDPKSLAKDSIFGQFLGEDALPDEPAAAGAGENADENVDEKDQPRRKIVIGQVTKTSGRDRFSVSIGERVDVGATLKSDAYVFVDSESIADLRPGDPIKLEGAQIGEGAMFAVKALVERPVPPEALEPPAADGKDDPAGPAPDAVASGARPAADGAAKPAVADGKTPEMAKLETKAAPVARGRIVEVN